MKLTFNTYKLISVLERKGFSRQQSEAILSALQSINPELNTLPYSEFTKSLISLKLELNQLKTEIIDTSILRTEHERLVSDVEKLKQRMREDISRLHASQRLEINLERGKAFDERSSVSSKLMECDSRIEQEMSLLRSGLRNVKLDTVRTLFTTMSTLGLVVLGYMRLFK